MRDGWTRVALGEVAQLDIDRVSVDPSVEYSVAGVLNAGQGLFEREPMPGSSTNYPALHRLRAGQVVMRKLTAWEGPITVVPDRFDGYFASPEFPTFTLDRSRVEPDFMKLVCARPELWGQLRDLSTGSVQRRKRVSPSRLLEVKLDLPPMSVQRRTVDLIDRIDTYALRARTCWGAARSIRSALLDDLLFPRGDERWATTTVGDVVRLVKRGRAPAYADDGLVVLSQKCVREENTLELGAARCTDADKRPIPDWAYVTVGDTLVASTGRGTLGRASYVAALPFDATVDSHVTIVRPESELVLPAYLGLVLSAMRSELEAYGSGSTNQTELSREAISSISIPLPPGSVQHDIVNLIDAFDSAIRPISSIVEALTSVRSSMLDELLSGEREIPPSYDELVGLVM